MKLLNVPSQKLKLFFLRVYYNFYLSCDVSVTFLKHLVITWSCLCFLNNHLVEKKEKKRKTKYLTF